MFCPENGGNGGVGTSGLAGVGNIAGVTNVVTGERAGLGLGILNL